MVLDWEEIGFFAYSGEMSCTLFPYVFIYVFVCVCVCESASELNYMRTRLFIQEVR